MVAIAYDELSFQVPTLLQSFELAPIHRGTSGRDVMRAENRFSFELFAREACHPIALAVNQRLIPFVDRLVMCHNRNELISQYNVTLDSVNAMARDWIEFMSQVYQCNDFSGGQNFGEDDPRVANDMKPLLREVAASEQNRTRDETLSKISATMPQFESVITAKFASERSDDFAIAVRNDCHVLMKDFVQACGQSLVEMVNLFTVGVSQWYPGNTCRYVYFRRKTVNSIDEFGQFTRRPAFGSTSIEITCHDHHLIDAYSCNPANAPGKIPEQAQRLVECTPIWLKDALTLVAGTLTQERVHIHQELNREWHMNAFFPHMCFDPAICIGPFVLTGWGPRDVGGNIEVEAKRLTSVDDSRPSRPTALSKAASFFSELLGGE